METLEKFLGRLATKSGLQLTDPKLAALIGNPALATIEVPDEIVTGMDNNLLSLTQATDNHPTIKNKYTAQALNGIDSRLTQSLSEIGLPADKIAEIQAEKNTYQRYDLVVAAVRDAATAAAKEKHKPEEKSALQQQVNDLLDQLKTQKTGYDSKLAELTAARQRDAVNYQVRSLYGGIRTVLDELPAESKIAALDALINKALLDKSASFNIDDAGVLILSGKDDAAVIGANNVRYTPSSLINEVLAQNKILTVNDNKSQTTGSSTNGNGSTGNGQRVNGGNPAPQGNSAYIAASNLETLRNFEKNVANA